MAEALDPVAEAEKWAAEVWGVGSPQYRWHLAYAAWRCPTCDGRLVPDRHGGRHRWCEKCDLEWFPQFSEADGSAKRGSLIACFRII
jgi:hypothetical protein